MSINTARVLLSKGMSAALAITRITLPTAVRSTQRTNTHIDSPLEAETEETAVSNERSRGAAPPFDPTTLDTESESLTQARNIEIEWSTAPTQSVFNDDYELDPAFDSQEPSGKRWDCFDDSYEELEIKVTLMTSGVLFGEGMLVCDARQPKLSAERCYLVPLKRIANRLWRYVQINVPSSVTYLVGGNSGYKNHYHWMSQCLPAILLLRKVVREQNRDYRIVLPNLGPRHWASLALAGIDVSECLVLEPDSFIYNVPLMYTNVASSRFTFQPSAPVIALLDEYRDTCLKRGNPELPTRFYVSRKDAPGKRELENENDLVHVLEERGYQELVLSELPIEDQVCAFARAEIIVAPHGAGLVNLMFATSSARLVEIMPENYRRSFFFRIAQARGMGYTEVISTIVRENAEDSNQSCILSVDVEHVLAALERSEHARSKCIARTG